MQGPEVAARTFSKSASEPSKFRTTGSGPLAATAGAATAGAATAALVPAAGVLTASAMAKLPGPGSKRAFCVNICRSLIDPRSHLQLQLHGPK